MSTPQVPGQAPPGWYADPGNAEQQRYWDGTAWTEQVAPRYIYGAPEQPTLPPPQGLPIQAASTRPTGPGGHPYASFGRRLVGYLIDMVVLVPVGMIIIFTVAQSAVQQLVTCVQDIGPSQNEITQRAFSDCINNAAQSPSLTVAAIVYGIAQLVYFTVLLATWGRTVGGQAMGLRCVMADGRKPILVKAFVRSVIPFGFSMLAMIPGVGFVANLVELVNYLAMLWSPKRQTWMDQAAGTYVIRVQ